MPGSSSIARARTSSIAYDGEPIPADRLDRVFAPFWRRTASREGLGLGLYICAQIVGSHEGTLTATSTAADGTRFVASLPVVVRRPPA